MEKISDSGISRMVKPAAAVGAIFGLMTIVSGGSVIFGGEGIKKLAGDYIPFVVWFNFIAGFAYFVAGAGLWKNRSWSAPLSLAISLLTGIVFLVFLGYVASGTPFEMRTMIALLFRGGLWGAIAFIAYRRFRTVLAGS